MNDKKSTPLREKMKADLMLRNYSKHSEELYLHHGQRFAEHYHKSPELLGLDEIRSYLLFLREKANVSQSSYKQTVAALRFLYKYTLGKEWLKEKIPYPKLRKRLPVVLTQEEVVAHIQAGKGAQERIAMLSPKLLQTLREYWRRYRPVDWLFPRKDDSPRYGVHAAVHVASAAKQVCQGALLWLLDQSKETASSSHHKSGENSGVWPEACHYAP